MALEIVPALQKVLLLQKVFESAIGASITEDLLDAANVVRHLFLYRLEDKPLAQIKVILVGYHDKMITVKYISPLSRQRTALFIPYPSELTNKNAS